MVSSYHEPKPKLAEFGAKPKPRKRWESGKVQNLKVIFWGRLEGLLWDAAQTGGFGGKGRQRVRTNARKLYGIQLFAGGPLSFDQLVNALMRAVGSDARQAL